MVAEMLNLLPGEGKAVRVKDMHAELNERDKQEQVERRYDMGAELRCDLIQAEEPGEHDDQDRGEAHGRVDADHHAKGDAPCESPGGYATAHLTQ